MADSIVVKFWGVRGSYPVPSAETVRYGGNTACVEVRAGGHTIILDAGTGIIGLGRDLMRRSALMSRSISTTLLFSHFHHDHTQGLPFFGPFYDHSARINIFGPDFHASGLEENLSRVMRSPAFPVTWEQTLAKKSVQPIRAGESLLIGQDDEHRIIHPADQAALRFFEKRHSGEVVHIRSLHSVAHPDWVLVYRIEWRGFSLVYATDIEGYSSNNGRLVNFAYQADLLIHDAQYTDAHYQGLLPGVPGTCGWGHSTIRMACDVAQAAKAQRLVLFHHEPSYDDWTITQNEQEARRLFPETLAAYEGLEVRLETGPEDQTLETRLAKCEPLSARRGDWRPEPGREIEQKNGALLGVV
jgi:phosphoribosyl 1,2-cyclic phosphodiesterase